jgi:hypothetical protein
MTDDQARLWHVQRKADLVRLIDRQTSVEALERLRQAAGHEFDSDLHRRLAQRVMNIKAERQADPAQTTAPARLPAAHRARQ